MLFENIKKKRLQKQIDKRADEIINEYNSCKRIFTIYYFDEDILPVRFMEIDDVQTPEEAIDIFQKACPKQYEEMKDNPYALYLTRKYSSVNPVDGRLYIYFDNSTYLRELEIKLAQPVIDKKSKPDPDLQPLYYKKNGTYYELGIYINPSELKQSDLFPALPEEQTDIEFPSMLSGDFIPINDTKFCSE